MFSPKSSLKQILALLLGFYRLLSVLAIGLLVASCISTIYLLMFYLLADNVIVPSYFCDTMYPMIGRHKAITLWLPNLVAFAYYL